MFVQITTKSQKQSIKSVINYKKHPETTKFNNTKLCPPVSKQIWFSVDTVNQSSPDLDVGYTLLVEKTFSEDVDYFSSHLFIVSLQLNTSYDK